MAAQGSIPAWAVVAACGLAEPAAQAAAVLPGPPAPGPGGASAQGDGLPSLPAALLSCLTVLMVAAGGLALGRGRLRPGLRRHRGPRHREAAAGWPSAQREVLCQPGGPPGAGGRRFRAAGRRPTSIPGPTTRCHVAVGAAVRGPIRSGVRERPALTLASDRGALSPGHRGKEARMDPILPGINGSRRRQGPDQRPAGDPLRRIARGDHRHGVAHGRASGRQPGRGRADGGPAPGLQLAARQDRLGRRAPGLRPQAADRPPGPLRHPARARAASPASPSAARARTTCSASATPAPPSARRWASPRPGTPAARTTRWSPWWATAP